MLKLTGAIFGILLAIIVVAILFLINPIIGVVGILWFVGWGIYALKFKKQ
jgi:4-hydroxybenzoate polyprenyltransferase